MSLVAPPELSAPITPENQTFSSPPFETTALNLDQYSGDHRAFNELVTLSEQIAYKSIKEYLTHDRLVREHSLANRFLTIISRITAKFLKTFPPHLLQEIGIQPQLFNQKVQELEAAGIFHINPPSEAEIQSSAHELSLALLNWWLQSVETILAEQESVKLNKQFLPISGRADINSEYQEKLSQLFSSLGIPLELGLQHWQKFFQHLIDSHNGSEMDLPLGNRLQAIAPDDPGQPSQFLILPGHLRTLQSQQNAEAVLRHTSSDPIVLKHADRLHASALSAISQAPISNNVNAQMKTILQTVFADPEIKDQFRVAKIRHTAMCGAVAKELLLLCNLDPDLISLMAIGDVYLPPFAAAALGQIYQQAFDYHRFLNQAEGTGYDLASQGSEIARHALIQYFNNHYQFHLQPNLIEKLTANSCITNGGMRALDDIAAGLLEGAHKQGQKVRFVTPDNSFNTWIKITELRSQHGQNAETLKITTDQKDHLHLTGPKIAEFYYKNPLPSDGTPCRDIWYITPVGNPSGTKMTPRQLIDSIAAISAHNPHAVMILDTVYLRTLPQKQARALMQLLMKTPGLLNQIIFVESFSKTHGLCGERIGMYFSANKELFSDVQNVNTMLSAGNGRYRSAMALALANSGPVHDETFRKLHQFWGRERRGLYAHLIENGQFQDVFDTDQSHLNPHDLESPLGIYLFLKIKEGLGCEEILARTGCLGVISEKSEMENGPFMRFSVGRTTQETYGKYIK